MRLLTVFCIVFCYLKISQGHSTRRNIDCGIQTKSDDDDENYARHPWNVGLFKISQQNDSYENICSGTIINSNFVLGAAHCFVDPFTKLKFNTCDLKIVAGKMKRNYYHVEDHQQVVRVKEVTVHEDYRGAINGYAYDIALAQIDPPFEFTKQVSPICIESSPIIGIPPNELGTVASWNFHEDRGYSDELEELKLPFLPKPECRKKVENLNCAVLRYITADKMCIVKQDGKGPSKGDGGGGFTFNHDGKYYIQGIVSGHLKNTNISLLTNIDNHLDWISQYGTVLE